MNAFAQSAEALLRGEIARSMTLNFRYSFKTPVTIRYPSAIKRFLIMAVLSFGLIGVSAHASDTRPIGTATMQEDGAIMLQLRAEGQGGVVGDYMQTIQPGDKHYYETIAHVGGLKPGESKPVPPYENDDKAQAPK